MHIICHDLADSYVDCESVIIIAGNVSSQHCIVQQKCVELSRET